MYVCMYKETKLTVFTANGGVNLFHRLCQLQKGTSSIQQQCIICSLSPSSPIYPEKQNKKESEYTTTHVKIVPQKLNHIKAQHTKDQFNKYPCPIYSY